MRPEDFLSLARELASRDDEASLRTAISRVYYALFHNARLILRSRHIRVPKGVSAHYEVPARLRELAYDENNFFYEALASELDTLRTLRVKADYHIERPFISPEHVRQIVRRAIKLKEQV